MRSVDVVIPAYNPGPFLAEALESVIAQSFRNWNAFVVDDGSSEDLSWVHGYENRIHLMRQHNQGLSAARNAGIAMGSGELVAFLDADDRWLPGKLAAQVAAMKPNVALCSTGFEFIDGNGVCIGQARWGETLSRSELLQRNGICVSTVLTRRTLLEGTGGFDPTLAVVQDWDLWIRLASVGTLVKAHEVLAQYRRHAENMSGDYLALSRDAVKMLARYRHGPDGSAVFLSSRQSGRIF